MSRSILIIVVLGLAAMVAAIGLNKSNAVDANETIIEINSETAADFAKAQHYLENDEPLKALKIIHQHENEMDYDSDAGKQWVLLFIEASNDVKNYPQMVLLYENFPKAFENNESASLEVAHAYILSHQLEDYEKIRTAWKEKETFEKEWFNLDVDKLLINNQRNEAIKLLQSRTFSDKEDTDRLFRLALLNTPNNAKAAWNYLTEAYIKDPSNPDVHTFRARLLESLGKNSLAQSEYLSAVQAAPGNAILKDQLAEFYMRDNQYNQAMTVWLESLKNEPSNAIWIKALFWNRVITPIHTDWTALPPPKGKLKPFIEYLIELKPNQFWNDKVFNEIPDAHRLLMEQQASFWLQLINDLKVGKEKKALELLQPNRFSESSWNPALENALKEILIYRSEGVFHSDAISNLNDNKEGLKKPNVSDNIFFNRLSELVKQSKPGQKIDNIPNDLHQLLLSDEVFTAAFLSVGWYEAALQLHSLTVIPKDLPDWLAVEITQALKRNRSNEEALKFAILQPRSQNLALTIARIALLEEDHSLAEKMYSQIEKNSSEAKSYLARKAFAEKNWLRARELTEALLNEHPDNEIIRNNLNKIIEEQEAKSS